MSRFARLHGRARSRGRMMFRSAVVLALLLPALGFRPAHTDAPQDMELPVELQVPLFLKMLSFDRQRCDQPELVIGIAFQRGFRASVLARDAAVQAVQAAGGGRFHVITIDVDRDQLSSVLSQQKVSVLYVAPLRAFHVEELAAAANAAHILTMTGVVRYVEQGIAASVRLQGDRPRLIVSLTASRLGGADFTAELLKLVQVVP